MSATMRNQRARPAPAAMREVAVHHDDRPVITREGYRLLGERAARLRDEVMPELVRAMRESEEGGTEGYEFDRAATELQRLIETLAQARIAEELSVSRKHRHLIRLGDEVELRFPDGEVEVYRIVHPAEAPVDDLRVSGDSPLGVAFLGRGPGDEVDVRAPASSYTCRLVEWSTRRSPRRLVAEIIRMTAA